MSKLLPILGLCLLGALVFFFTQLESDRRGQGAGTSRPPSLAPEQSAAATASPLERPQHSALPERTEELRATDSAGGSSGRQVLAKSNKRPAGGSHPRARLRTLVGTLVANGSPQSGGQCELFAGDRVVGRAESNRKGEFELEFPIPAERLVLRVNARGFAILEKDLGNQHVPGQQLLGNLFLEPGIALSGLVVDPRGQPIRGAEVTMSQLNGPLQNTQLGQRARTDDSGRFVFGSAPSGRVNLHASAEGYGLVTLQHIHSPGKEPKLELAPGTSLKVRVSELGGGPVSGARLSLRSVSGRGMPPRQAESDAEGIAHFKNLVPSDWSLHSITKGYKPGILTSIPSGTKEVSLVLVAWPRAKGRLLAPGGEAPPEGAEVLPWLHSQRGDFAVRLPRGQPVEADGSFQLLDLRPGNYRVRATAPGYAPTFSKPFEVQDGSDVSLPVLELQRGGELLLKVNAGGLPAAGVSAEVLRQTPRPGQLWNAPNTPLEELPVSDAEGHLRVVGQTPGEVWIILRGAGMVPLQLGPTTIHDGEVQELTNTQTLTLAGSIEGSLHSNTGAKLPLGRIRLTGSIERIPTQISDNQGRFSFRDLPPGSYFLLPSGSVEGRQLEGASHEVQVKAGEVTQVRLTIQGE